MRTFLDCLQRAIDNAPTPAIKAKLQAILGEAGSSSVKKNDK